MTDCGDCAPLPRRSGRRHDVHVPSPYAYQEAYWLVPAWMRAVRDSRTSWHSGGWIEYASDMALWYHGGKDPLPIRWVLVRYPDGRRDTEAFLCTDPEAAPLDVLDCYNHRWAMESTYEESRSHLGIETERQWSDPAIFRTTPLLFGLYSVALLCHFQANILNNIADFSAK